MKHTNSAPKPGADLHVLHKVALLILAETTHATTTTRYLHSPLGIHAAVVGDAWHTYGQDGLGSVRSVVDAAGAVLQSIGYTPYGVPDAVYPWAFTGEQRDGTGIQYHRARYYNPGLGAWASLDPFEGDIGRIMSLNGYSWVEGQVVDATDASGKIASRSLLNNAININNSFCFSAPIHYRTSGASL